MSELRTGQHRRVLARFLASDKSKIRTADFKGAEHMVVPVIALVEGVIRPSNSTGPELALAEEFGHVPAGWNGRPVTSAHPEVDGRSVSANDPVVLESWQVGLVFQAAMVDKALHVEAWIDTARAKKLGGDAARLVERLEAGEDVEVSVGVFVDLEEKPGEYRGLEYQFVWHNVVPDHLALLREDETGACSIQMGCGAPRAAAAGSEEVPMSDKTGTAAADVAAVTRDNYKGFMARVAEVLGIRAGDPEPKVAMTDADLRGALDIALREAEPNYLGIYAVNDNTEVIYHSFAENGGGIRMYSRSFSMKAKKIVLGDNRTEVRTETSFVPAKGDDKQEAPAAPKAASKPCGCGGHDNAASAAPQETMNMKTKTERVKALVASKHTKFTESDQKWLEATPDEGIEVIEKQVAADEAAEAKAKADADAKQAADKAAADKAVADKAAADKQASDDAAQRAAAAAQPKALTTEELEKLMPQDMRDLLSEARAAKVAQHTSLVAQLKDAQAEYTEDELKAMTVEQLRRLSRLLDVDVPQAAADWSGMGLPRAAAAQAGSVYANPPDPWAKPQTKEK